MADGHGKSVLHRFFDDFGDQRAAALTHISADGAGWIADVLAERARRAARVMDPFHVVAWATDALALKDSRFALWKNEADLTDRQAVKLTWIAATDPRLHRAYRLKEALRAMFTLAKTRPTAALKDTHTAREPDFAGARPWTVDRRGPGHGRRTLADR